MNTLNTSTSLMLASILLASCQTLQTGGKVVDNSRREIVLSSNSDPRSALPQGNRDSSITNTREQLEDFVKTNPKDVKAIIGLAELQFTQGSLAESEASCRKALLLDVKNQDAKRVLAQIAIRRGNFDLASIFISALGGEESKDSTVLNMLGLIAYGQKDYTGAMRLWKQAVNLNSGDISARMNLGVMYLRNKLFSQASAQFERVLKIAPAHQDARLHLAVVEASRGKFEQAIEIYKSILAKDTANPLALFNMSLAQKNAGLYDDAVDGLKRFIKASPERSTATDRAFALIEEINTLKSGNGEKVSDDELQSLADELASRRSAPIQQATQTTKSANGAERAKASSETSSTTKKQVAVKKTATAADQEPTIDARPTTSDSEIEALENQLRAPAH